MPSVKTYLITTFILFIGLSELAMASTLYASDRKGNNGTPGVESALYSIDTTTGVVTTIGSIGHSVSDLAWNRQTGQLYGSTIPSRHSPFPGHTGIITIDTTTGAGTIVGETRDLSGNLINVLQIDIDSNGNMYGSPKSGNTGLLKIDSSNGNILSQTKTIVQAEFNGSTFPFEVSVGQNGLAFDSLDNLWRDRDPGNSGNTTINLVSTDITTGTNTPEITIDLSSGSLVYSGGTELEGAVGVHGTIELDTDTYWAVLDNKITIHNLTTGELLNSFDLINAPFSQRGLHALAFANPVPVPATVWLFLSGLLGLVRLNRKITA